MKTNLLRWQPSAAYPFLTTRTSSSLSFCVFVCLFVCLCGVRAWVRCFLLVQHCRVRKWESLNLGWLRCSRNNTVGTCYTQFTTKCLRFLHHLPAAMGRPSGLMRVPPATRLVMVAAVMAVALAAVAITPVRGGAMPLQFINSPPLLLPEEDSLLMANESCKYMDYSSMPDTCTDRVVVRLPVVRAGRSGGVVNSPIVPCCHHLKFGRTCI